MSPHCKDLRTYAMMHRRATLPLRRPGAFLALLCAATLASAAPDANDWQTLPSRRDADPAFQFHPSPEDWRDVPIYQIVTDRFADGDPANNLANPAAVFNPYGPDSLHGGDFAGVLAHLDYIESLGMKAIWISPVCLNEQGRYHGYAAWDFNAIDPHWGTLEALRALIDAAHQRGLYVLLDVVFNHMAGVVTSQHPDYPRFRDPEYPIEWRWPDHVPPAPFHRLSRFHGHGDIADWQDPHQVLVGSFSGLADLRTTDPHVRQDLIRIFSALIEATDCDGFRIDSVRHVETDFYEEVLPALRQHAAQLGKADFLITGEVWSSRQEVTVPFAGETRFDSLLDFPLRRIFERVFFEDEAISLLPAYRRGLAEYPPLVRDRLVTFLDNHDKARLLSMSNLTHPQERLSAALVFQFTQGQIPCLYYGTEQGFDGGSDPANREDFFDGEYVRGPSIGDSFNVAHPLFRLTRRLNLLREAHPALRRGVHRPLFAPDAGPGLYLFSMAHEGEELLIAVNNAATPAEASIHLRETSLPGTETLVDLLALNEATIEPSASTIALTLPAFGAAILAPQTAERTLPPSLDAIDPPHDARLTEAPRKIRFVFDRAMSQDDPATLVRIEPALDFTATWSHDAHTLTVALDTPASGSRRVSISRNARSADGLALGVDMHSLLHIGTSAVRSPLGPFRMDGRLDEGVPLLAEQGKMRLYAAFDAASGALYVAAPPARDGNDHFIFVTDTLLPEASAPLPWNKDGRIAADGPFLADENDNDFHAWRRVNGRAGAASGDILEGVVNLYDHFGRIPNTVYLAVAAYETPERGRLVPGLQAPAPEEPGADLGPDAFAHFNTQPRPAPETD